jgi:hypothetical protein
MIFQTCQHYFLDDNNDLIDNTTKIYECFICLENDDTSNQTILRLQTVGMVQYYKTCNCDGWIHPNCLIIWYNLQKTCPICRKLMDKNIMIAITKSTFMQFFDCLLYKICLLFKLFFFIYGLYFILFYLYYFGLSKMDK